MNFLKFSAFLITFSMFVPSAHAIVVTPFIAIGAVQLTVWLIGVLTVPVAVIVRTIGKTKLSKTLFVTGIILVLTALLAFMLIKTLKVSKYVIIRDTVNLNSTPPQNTTADRIQDLPFKPYGNSITTGVPIKSMPYFPPPQFIGILGLFLVFTMISFISVFPMLFALNLKKGLWNKKQLVLLGLAFSIVLSASVLFVLVVVVLGPYIY